MQEKNDMKENIYMDAAASWLKPDSVIKAQTDFLTNSYANAGRGICERAGNVDKMVADARNCVAGFINADVSDVIFVSGATDAFNRIVNIVKQTIKGKFVVAVSDLDHHSARLPWENLAKNDGCDLIVCPLDSALNIDIENIPNCDVFVITAMSNVMGVAQDVEEIIRSVRAKNPNVITIVDAAQYVVHNKIDVKKFDCDFCVFSGHKIGADTGVGVMYIKNADSYEPDKFGGGMINKILSDNSFILNKAPEKFEAGTLPITQIIGLNEAVKKFSIRDESRALTNYMYDELSKMKNIKLLTLRDSVLISFVPTNMHVIDFGAMLGVHDICVRVGNMCASWIHKRLNVDGSVRISVGPWNTMDDAKYVVDVIRGILK